RTLVVEHPQRIELGAAAGLLVQRQREEELLEQLAVAGTAGVVAERGDLEPEAVEAERAEARVGDRDDLGVQRRVVDADGLDADLLQLAVAPGLGTLVAEERTGVGQLDRQRAAVEAVLDDGAHDARGALRAQRAAAGAAN